MSNNTTNLLENPVVSVQEIATEVTQDPNQINEYQESQESEKTITPNCYIMRGPKILDLRLTQRQVGSKEKVFFDSEWGWCFFDKSDAEKIAEKLSRSKDKIIVSPFYSERACKMKHGTDLEKKHVKLETLYLIKKQALDDLEAKIRKGCNLEKFEFDDLYENSLPDHFNEKRKKVFELFKPMFDDWIKDKAECEEVEKGLLACEDKIKEFSKEEIKIRLIQSKEIRGIFPMMK